MVSTEMLSFHLKLSTRVDANSRRDTAYHTGSTFICLVTKIGPLSTEATLQLLSKFILLVSEYDFETRKDRPVLQRCFVCFSLPFCLHPHLGQMADHG